MRAQIKVNSNRFLISIPRNENVFHGDERDENDTLFLLSRGYTRAKHFSLLIPRYKERSPARTWCAQAGSRGAVFSELKRCPQLGEAEAASALHPPTWIIAHECRI